MPKQQPPRPPLRSLCSDVKVSVVQTYGPARPELDAVQFTHEI